MRNFLPCLLAFFSLAIPASAFGAESTDPAAKPLDGLKGFEISLRPAVGAAPSDSPVKFEPDAGTQVQGNPGGLLTGQKPWGPGFVGDAMIGYRFIPQLSAGLRAGIRTASSEDLSDGSKNLSRFGYDAGFYVHAYPLAGIEGISRYVDPWVGVGVGYGHDSQKFQFPVSNVTADIAVTHHAVVIPIGIGADYRLTKFLSLGPSFEYKIASAVAGCVETSASGFAGTTYCSNSSPGETFVKAHTYGVWSAGLDARMTF